MMMTVALRFIPTLIEEADKITKAQLARGADFESGNVFKRAKSMLPILIPLFVNSFRRADELAMAMESPLLSRRRRADADARAQISYGRSCCGHYLCGIYRSRCACTKIFARCKTLLI